MWEPAPLRRKEKEEKEQGKEKRREKRRVDEHELVGIGVINCQNHYPCITRTGTEFHCVLCTLGYLSV